MMCNVLILVLKRDQCVHLIGTLPQSFGIIKVKVIVNKEHNKTLTLKYRTTI